MAQQEIISREHMGDKNGVVITETVRKTFSISELQQEINNYRAQQESIVYQANQLKIQYDNLEDLIKQVQEILSSIDSTPEFPQI